VTGYLPFINDPAHLSRLNAQRFVVLRAPLWRIDYGNRTLVVGAAESITHVNQ
jgi:hypothetical protein